MSRRSHNSDLEFGSDSFLDIIANIVGILIILIVVAGVKVARQPAITAAVAVTQTDDLSPVPAAPDPVLTEPADTQSAEAEQPLVALPDADSVVPETAEQDPEPQPPAPSLPDVDPQELAQLTEQIAKLQLQLNGTASTAAVSAQELQELLQETESLRGRQAATTLRLQDVGRERDTVAERVLSLSRQLDQQEDSLAAVTGKLAASQRHQQFLADRLHAVGAQTQQLQEVLEAARVAVDSSERLQHRLSPVGEPVTEEELHFRISDGRIAHIPLEALLERLKAQVSARRTTVMRLNRYEGTVGPVGGFRMQYTVERDTLSPLQSLQYGAGGYRISVSRWTLVPAETLAAEPVDDAVMIGSRFRQVLETAPLNSTVTIWLYPDDFAAFRQVRELAHGLNLRIAARPLPPGTPIAGSPSGSRSSSQ